MQRRSQFPYDAGKTPVKQRREASWHLVVGFPASLDAATVSELLALSARLSDFELERTRVSGLIVAVERMAGGDSLSGILGRLDPSNLPFSVYADDTGGCRALRLPGTALEEARAGRATWLLDSLGVVRARLCYPYETARPIDELLRLTMALRSAEANETVIPEGWKPGDDSGFPNVSLDLSPTPGLSIHSYSD